jgi:hypothetical protein
MAFKTRHSKHLVAAQDRLTKVESIDPQMVLAEDLTVPVFRQAVETLAQKLGAYNGHMAEAASLGNEIGALELGLRDLHERVLLGVASRFGKDSTEYEQAGGVRKSERKSPRRTPKEG